MALEWIDLADVLKNFRPAPPQPWTWDDEERDILGRTCICCDKVGHYIAQLEDHLRDNGLTEGVCLDFEDHRVRDGHHRIIAARRLGITRVPLESAEQATERWIRDEGHADWHDRKHGDRSAWERELRKSRAEALLDPKPFHPFAPRDDGHNCIACDENSIWKCDEKAHSEVLPRWEDDPVVIANGWNTPDHCGNCGLINPQLAAAEERVRELEAQVTADTLAEALQDAWNDFCSDAGCLPDWVQIHGPASTRVIADFEGKGIEWVRLVAERLMRTPPNRATKEDGDE